MSKTAVHVAGDKKSDSSRASFSSNVDARIVRKQSIKKVSKIN